MLARCLRLAVLGICFVGCAAPPPAPAALVADLADGSGFAAANPGYDVENVRGCHRLAPAAAARVAFVQGPPGRSTAPTVGDLLLLRPGEGWQLAVDGRHGGDGAGRGVDLVVFTVPVPLPPELPAQIRPDHDANIRDAPGGCADDPRAYRRIELTWSPEVGPYVLHGLNAHRVRIDDSFSHYHPRDGGFDELYLVQAAPPEARLITSTEVPAIEARTVTRDQAKGLLQTRPLRRDQLVCRAAPCTAASAAPSCRCWPCRASCRAPRSASITTCGRSSGRSGSPGPTRCRSTSSPRARRWSSDRAAAAA